MSNPTNTLIHTLAYADNLSPQIIDEVSDDEMYIGYAAPDCTSLDEDKWLIKRVLKQGTIQTICYANGERRFNKAWTSRTSYLYGFNPKLIIPKEEK